MSCMYCVFDTLVYVCDIYNINLQVEFAHEVFGPNSVGLQHDSHEFLTHALSGLASYGQFERLQMTWYQECIMCGEVCASSGHIWTRRANNKSVMTLLKIIT